MTDSAPIRVALVEDELEHAHELKEILSAELGFQWCAACRSAEEALEVVPSVNPDILLMDIYLGAMSGIECVWRMKEVQFAVPIVICTAIESEDLVVEAIAAGASGYFLKHDPPDLIRTAVRDVAKGCFIMTRPVARDLRQFFAAIEPHTEEGQRLSPKEMAALKEIALGYMDSEIVDHLKIQMPTLRTYIRNIFEKLHVGTRTEAARKYWQSREGRFQRLSGLLEKVRSNDRRRT